MEEILVRFHGDGEIEIKTQGYRGRNACHVATDDIVKLLGTRVDSDIATAEANLTESRTEQVRLRS